LNFYSSPAPQAFLMRPIFRLVLLGGAFLLAACSEKPAPPKPAAGPPQFVGSAACADCHTTQYSDWTDSHHDLAMQVANETTMLGDFDQATFDYFGTSTEFFKEDGQFVVRTANGSGESEDFAVTHTFGVTPLQQYLVEFPGGRLQALPFAWDSRAESAGGQHWIHLNPDEFIEPGDELHWTGRQYNWNYMCAECHSTDLQVNYDLKNDSFDTTWAEMDVGCEACHGPASRHVFKDRRQPGTGHRHARQPRHLHGR
jgi:hypothetical protein